MKTQRPNTKLARITSWALVKRERTHPQLVSGKTISAVQSLVIRVGVQDVTGLADHASLVARSHKDVVEVHRLAVLPHLHGHEVRRRRPGDQIRRRREEPTLVGQGQDHVGIQV